MAEPSDGERCKKLSVKKAARIFELPKHIHNRLFHHSCVSFFISNLS